MLLLKILFLPIYILLLPFKLLFGSSNSDEDNAMDDFLDDCDYFDNQR